jgi:hydrogenase-1 operon protein HyaF
MNSQFIPIHNNDSRSVGNIRALLTEIAERLEKLNRDNETGMIALNCLPFTPGEYDLLRKRLGRGEVSVRIETAGYSDIIETQYPGVWWVSHYNIDGEMIADTLEITTIPEIIRSQPVDISCGLELLRAQLNQEVPQ